MREVGVLSAVLAVLLIVAYASWTKEEEKVTEEKAVIVQASPDDLESAAFITRTQTVTLSRRDLEGQAFLWFEIETKTRKRGFVAEEKVKDLVKSFAPFEAIRSLGSRFSEEEIDTAKLKKPERKLVLSYKSGAKTYEVGGRTHGSRDHYLRPSGGKEIFLVASKVLGDLEYPEGRFMQRKLRVADSKDVVAAVVEAGGKSRRFLHQNRLSEKDAFWAEEASQDAKSETAENYLHKADTLSIRRYATAEEPIEGGDEVLKVRWYGEGDKELESVTLYRLQKEGEKQPSYYAIASATKGIPVDVTRSVAEQLEQDLPVILQ